MRNPRVNFAARGLTLVELLVVVTILVILVGVVLPLAQPALKGREKREAARQIQAAFAAAQARAVADRSEYGVALIPSNTTGRCETLAFARIPSPFSGADLNDSRVALNTGNGQLGFIANGMPDANTIQVLQKLIEDGGTFQIRFNFRGTVYNAERTGGNFRIIENLNGRVIPPEANAAINPSGCRYQVIRSPALSAASPLELPLGAYIDLTQSGFDEEPNAAYLNPNLPTIVLFGADGKVSRAFNGGMAYVQEPLYLLVANGKEVGVPNLDIDAGSLWVSVDPRSGTAKTADNLGTRQSAIEGPNTGGR